MMKVTRAVTTGFLFLLAVLGIVSFAVTLLLAACVAHTGHLKAATTEIHFFAEIFESSFTTTPGYTVGSIVTA